MSSPETTELTATTETAASTGTISSKTTASIETGRFDSSADVATDRSGRYLKQLSSHFGRKLDTTVEEGRAVLTFPMGRCELLSRPDTLRINLTSPTVGELDTLENVVASHLIRFGTQDELSVVWKR